jgi:hypothetical protein
MHTLTSELLSSLKSINAAIEKHSITDDVLINAKEPRPDQGYVEHYSEATQLALIDARDAVEEALGRAFLFIRAMENWK